MRKVAHSINSPIRVALDDASAKCGSARDTLRGVRWYVAQTLARREPWAIEHLRAQGFQTFFPRFRKQVTRRAGAQLVLAPVFPGYVFVSFDAELHHWPAIRGTRGVRRLVGPAGGRPQAVPERVMGCLLDRCRGEVMLSPLDDLRPGDRVQVNVGPLARRIAEVHSLPGAGRVRLLLDLLGAGNLIDVDASSLGPVAS